MTTLLFDVPLDPKSVSYNLTLPTDYQRHYHFVASEILHRGHSEVFRGRISYDRFPNGIVVICKLVKGNLTRLKREAELYSGQLKPLQGIHVPYFFGLYLGRHTTEDDVNMPIGCIILEDCGSRITAKALRELKVITRTVKALVAVHRAGVEHGDFHDNDFRHVIVSPRNPLAIRIIDFNDTDPHDCQAKPIEIWGYEPAPGGFGCRELYDVCYAIGAWTPVLFTFLGRDYTIFRAATIGRLALLAQYDGNPENDSEEARRFYWGKALEFFDTYYKAYGDRFATIRHPLEFNEPLGLEGFEEPLTVEFGDIPPPWETAEWMEHREKLEKDASKRFPVL